MTLTEMEERAARIVDAVELPVFADGDAGSSSGLEERMILDQFELWTSLLRFLQWVGPPPT